MNLSYLFLLIVLSLINEDEAVPMIVTQDFNCVQDAFPPPNRTLVPHYTLNLDLPPDKRWDQIIRENKKEIHALVGHVENLLIDALGNTLFNVINSSLPKLTDTFPSPYKEEILGMAKSGQFSIPEITLYNIFYEVFSLCTSIIAEGEAGQIVHARNLDFGLFMGWDKKNHTWIVSELLQPLVMDVTFMKGGKPIYSATTYAGFLGILNGVKKGKFSFSLDERFSLNGGYVGILEWILFKDHNQSWNSFLTRNVMENADSYDDAQTLLSKTRLIAPIYFILAGTKPRQGVIITRDRNKYDLLPLGSKKDGIGSWFLVQTNYDHWDAPPFYDDRRTPASSCLVSAGRKDASLKLLYNVLSTKPVLNKLTTYTSVMEPGSGSLKTWLRSCPDPCSPW